MRKTLSDYFKEHTGKVSDKWMLYLNEWDRLFEPYWNQPISLFEIGIQNGGSLEIWAKYFIKAEKIVGCDVNEKCSQLKFADDRIAVVVGDANSDDCENEILRQAQNFDIIIDDGSHKSSDVIRSFARYFPHLNDNGIYIVEDMHTSYWGDFEGGLYSPLSAISFIKRLADIVNYEHWRSNKSRVSMLMAFMEKFGIIFEESELARIHSIEFVNSLCIIKKMPYENNHLGKRITVGLDDSITGDGTKSNGTLIQDFDVTITDDANLDVFELIELTTSTGFTIREAEQTIQSITSQVENQERENRNLNFLLAQSQEEILFYANSKSWKITRPLRKLSQFIRGKKNA